MSALKLTQQRVDTLRNALADLTRVQTLLGLTREALEDAQARGLEIDVARAEMLSRGIGDLIAELRSIADV